jgi:hypothetical protein
MINISTLLTSVCTWLEVAVVLAVVPILRICGEGAKACAHDWRYKKYCINKEISIRYLKTKPARVMKKIAT